MTEYEIKQIAEEVLRRLPLQLHQTPPLDVVLDHSNCPDGCTKFRGRCYCPEGTQSAPTNLTPMSVSGAFPNARRRCSPGCFYFRGRCWCPIGGNDEMSDLPGSIQARTSMDGSRSSRSVTEGIIVDQILQIDPEPEHHRHGWLPDEPDLRDFTWDPSILGNLDDPRAAELYEIIGQLPKKKSTPKKVDLRPWCADVEDQGQIGSCTANAVVGLIEYFARRRGDVNFEGSRLFVYKTARLVARLVGDTGVSIRSALYAVAACGVPPAIHWPYTDDQVAFDTNPDNFAYSLAQSFKAIRYFRFDPWGVHTLTNEDILKNLQNSLRMEIPFAFGFHGYPSLDHPDTIPGEIPFPEKDEKSDWAHALVGVGYDDSKKIVHPVSGVETKGAFLIRNSWGKNWGEAGYGWLPYEYVRNGLANDYWAIIDMKWFNQEVFDRLPDQNLEG